MEKGEERTPVLTWLRQSLSARYDRVLAEPMPPALLRALGDLPR